MKKLITLISVLLLNFSIFAQLSIESQQILVPQNVYIGDVAELRVSFNMHINGISNANTSSIQNLSQSFFNNELNLQEYTIKNLSLMKSGIDSFTFIISFIPWKTGTIAFPSYNLGEALSSQSENETIDLSYAILKFDKVEIDSILKQSSDYAIRDFDPPKVIPGTIYKIYLYIIIFVLLLILFIRLLIKRNEVKRFFYNYQLNVKYRKNKNSTIKKLRKITKSDEYTDKESAEQIQKIIRSYLEKKFDAPFSRCTTSEILPLFFNVTNNLQTIEKEIAMEKINATFIRTDFIRYASNVQNNSCFNENELIQLIDTLISAIYTIENLKSEIDSENDSSTEDLC